MLGVHASPGADDGPGIEPGLPDQQLGALLAGCAADVVIGGHTHRAADRVIGCIRALNPGSAGIPEHPGQAGWLLLEFTDDHGDDPEPANGRGWSTGQCPSTSMPWSVTSAPACTRTRSSSSPS